MSALSEYKELKAAFLKDDRFDRTGRLAMRWTYLTNKDKEIFEHRLTTLRVLSAPNPQSVYDSIRTVISKRWFKWKNKSYNRLVRNYRPGETLDGFKKRVQREINHEVGFAWKIIDITKNGAAPHTLEEFCREFGRYVNDNGVMKFVTMSEGNASVTLYSVMVAKGLEKKIKCYGGNKKGQKMFFVPNLARYEYEMKVYDDLYGRHRWTAEERHEMRIDRGDGTP
jgi:hypothetical protein